MAYKIVNDDSLTSVANAIRTKGGTSASLTFPSGFVSAINDIPAGGDHDAEDGIIQRNISGAYTNSRVMEIGNYTFHSCTGLTTASFPNVTDIRGYAFSGCTSLTTVSFPSATSIGNYAFQSCTSLTTVSFPNVTDIGSYAFYRCANLTTASFPNATSIGGSAFYNCNSLTEIYFMASSVVNLTNVNVFAYTPMSYSSYIGSFGSIYVPASLVADYKVAAKWSTYAARITSYVG